MISSRTADVLSLVAVQNFIRCGYHSCGEFDVVKLILTDEYAGNAFKNYSISIQHLKGRNIQNIPEILTYNDSSCTAIRNSNPEVEHSIIADTNHTNNFKPTHKSTNMGPTFTIDELAGFMESFHFQDWQVSHIKNVLNVTSSTISETIITIPDILAAGEDNFFAIAEASMPEVEATAEYVLNSTLTTVIFTEPSNSAAEVSKVTIPDVLVKNVMDKVDYLEIHRLMRFDPWLFSFITLVENLPISISLATARKDRRGFPLVYVNKYFETLTGYPNSVVTGANCRFLRTGIRRPPYRSDLESVGIVSNALRLGLPASVAMTNFKKNGTQFRNLLSIKPIFDIYGEYQYVIGMQLDITSRRDESFIFMNKMFSLLEILPRIV